MWWEGKGEQDKISVKAQRHGGHGLCRIVKRGVIWSRAHPA
jgi:hypothetical protein